MAYEFTFTPRFQKHFKGLTVQEKKQLKNKLELLAQNPSHQSLRTKRIQGTTDLFEYRSGTSQNGCAASF